MKKLFGFFTAVMCALLIMSSAVCAEGDIKVILDGGEVGFDVPPMIIKDRTMVPMRAVFEALGADVEWDEATRTVTARRDDTELLIVPDSDVMIKNSQPVRLDAGCVIIDGRTLVPVRAVSEAFGCNVSWEQDTRSVIIKTDDYLRAELSAGEVRTVEVKTAQELLDAIGSNTVIKLTEKSYNLTDLTSPDNPFLKKLPYGANCIIVGANNLTISGDAEIIMDDPYSEVLAFEDCSGITLEGITAGHAERLDEYQCDAAVTMFNGCSDVRLEKCSLFGCGSIGIAAYSVNGLTAVNCHIYDCTYTGISLDDSDNVLIESCDISDSSMLAGFCDIGRSNAVFKGCTVRNIVCGETLLQNYDFDENDTTQLLMENCAFSQNSFTDTVGGQINPTSRIRFKGCTFENNSAAVTSGAQVTVE